MSLDIQSLQSIVQHNCHIADAQHAGDYTLCTYLMKMRELYRWEKGLGFDVALTTREVSQWVREREAVWEDLEDSDFSELSIDGVDVHPFESEAANTALLPRGLVYSGGLGRKSAPHFFLGELLQSYESSGYEVIISGKEYARDLTSPPAMMRGNTIYIRKESLRRMIWERVQESRFQPADNPIGRTLSHYPLEEDLEGSLDALVEGQIGTLIRHEIGEMRAGADVDESWRQLLAALAGSRAELELRAVRDNLADSLETLPYLLERNQPELLHFYFATFSAMRRELFRALHAGYLEWLESDNLSSLESAVCLGQQHWRSVMQQAIEIHQQNPEKLALAVTTMIAEHHLLEQN